MLIDEGIRLLLEVQKELAGCLDDPRSAKDEDLVALRSKARAAIDRLDDNPHFDEAHRALDEVGQYVRRSRPGLCFLTEDGESYLQRCPVALGHVRIGVSPGIEIIESHCSICEEDPWVCPHIPGMSYEGDFATRVITKATFFEVSFVARPDFPDARILSFPVSRTEIETAFGGPLPSNARPVCDRCLSPCPGIRQTSLSAGP